MGLSKVSSVLIEMKDGRLCSLKENEKVDLYLKGTIKTIKV